jgi:peptidoglycan/xylan/chitin deacetylase (PgdA/CDA1 family)
MLKQLVKELIIILYFNGGIFHLVRFVNNIMNKRVTIVTYHRVTDKDINEIELSLPYLFTSKKNFEKQLQFFKKWYKVVSFADILNYAKEGNIPWNCLIITFDDGYADNYHEAYPTLKEMDLTATFFIPAGKIGSNDSRSSFWWDRAYYYFKELQKLDGEAVLREFDHELVALFEEFKRNPSDLFSGLNKEESLKIEKMLKILQNKLKLNNNILAYANSTMTWKQISAMGEDMHFGSHTCSHDNILTMEQTRKVYEINESKKIIEEKTKRNVDVFSYPCGNIDDHVRTLVKDAGYEFAVTTEKGVNDLTDRYALKRINIWEETGLSLTGEFSKGFFAFKLSGI